MIETARRRSVVLCPQASFGSRPRSVPHDPLPSAPRLDRPKDRDDRRAARGGQGVVRAARGGAARGAGAPPGAEPRLRLRRPRGAARQLRRPPQVLLERARGRDRHHAVLVDAAERRHPARRQALSRHARGAARRAAPAHLLPAARLLQCDRPGLDRRAEHHGGERPLPHQRGAADDRRQRRGDRSRAGALPRRDRPPDRAVQGADLLARGAAGSDRQRDGAPAGPRLSVHRAAADELQRGLEPRDRATVELTFFQQFRGAVGAAAGDAGAHRRRSTSRPRRAPDSGTRGAADRARAALPEAGQGVLAGGRHREPARALRARARAARGHRPPPGLGAALGHRRCSCRCATPRRRSARCASAAAGRRSTACARRCAIPTAISSAAPSASTSTSAISHLALCTQQVRQDALTDSLNYYVSGTLRMPTLFGPRIQPSITLFSERTSEYARVLPGHPDRQRRRAQPRPRAARLPPRAAALAERPRSSTATPTRSRPSSASSSICAARPTSPGCSRTTCSSCSPRRSRTTRRTVCSTRRRGSQQRIEFRYGTRAAGLREPEPLDAAPRRGGDLPHPRLVGDRGAAADRRALPAVDGVQARHRVRARRGAALRRRAELRARLRAEPARSDRVHRGYDAHRQQVPSGHRGTIYRADRGAGTTVQQYSATGGNTQVVATLEWRVTMPKPTDVMQLAAFVDAGYVWNRGAVIDSAGHTGDDEPERREVHARAWASATFPRWDRSAWTSRTIGTAPATAPRTTRTPTRCCTA